MEKITLLVLIVGLFLMVGILFASAHFGSEEKSDGGEEMKEDVQQACGDGTCNFQCRGQCGVPSCGCRR